MPNKDREAAKQFEWVRHAAKEMAQAAAQGKCEDATNSWLAAIRYLTRAETFAGRRPHGLEAQEQTAHKKLKGARAAFAKHCKIVRR